VIYSLIVHGGWKRKTPYIQVCLNAHVCFYRSNKPKKRFNLEIIGNASFYSTVLTVCLKCTSWLITGVGLGEGSGLVVITQ